MNNTSLFTLIFDMKSQSKILYAFTIYLFLPSVSLEVLDPIYIYEKKIVGMITSLAWMNISYSALKICIGCMKVLTYFVCS